MSSGPVGALVGQWPDVGEARRSGEFRCSQRAAAASLDFRIVDVCNSPVLADTGAVSSRLVGWILRIQLQKCCLPYAVLRRPAADEPNCHMLANSEVAWLVVAAKCRVELGLLRVLDAHWHLPDPERDIDKPSAGGGDPSLHIRPRRGLLATIRNWQRAGRCSRQGRKDCEHHKYSHRGLHQSYSVVTHLGLLTSTLLRLRCSRRKLLLSRRSRETGSGRPETVAWHCRTSAECPIQWR